MADLDEMTASWEDGDTWKVAGLSLKEFMELSKEMKGTTKKGEAMVGSEDHKDGGKVTVIRYSRKVKEAIIMHLAIMYKPENDNKKMILQLVLKDWYKHPERFMIEQMMEFCKGSDKNSLDHAKAAYINDMDEFKTTATGAKKRPAAAVAKYGRPAKKTDTEVDSNGGEDVDRDEEGGNDEQESGSDNDEEKEGADEGDEWGEEVEEPALKRPATKRPASRSNLTRLTEPSPAPSPKASRASPPPPTTSRAAASASASRAPPPSTKASRAPTPSPKASRAPTPPPATPTRTAPATTPPASKSASPAAWSTPSPRCARAAPQLSDGSDSDGPGLGLF
jgi:hypothetical protein